MTICSVTALSLTALRPLTPMTSATEPELFPERFVKRELHKDECAELLAICQAQEPFPEELLEDDRYEEDVTDFLNTYKLRVRSHSRRWLFEKAWAAGWRTDWDSGWRDCP